MLNRPNLKIFINSLRDIGYSCETAVADLIDNSIAADAKQIKIYALPSRGSLVILDDGCGMNRNELVEAMRLGTIHEQRTERDLGSFGLGIFILAVGVVEAARSSRVTQTRISRWAFARRLILICASLLERASDYRPAPRSGAGW